jgi:potassium/hydrogen antiporter
MAIDPLIAGTALLLLLSVVLSKATERLGVPALLIFLALGMLAGSDGPGGVYFDDAWTAQAIGTVALCFILFAGGLDTDLDAVRPVWRPGLVLATAGVLLSAALMGVFAWAVFRFTPLEGLLLGSIVASTDAAAVFSVLRSKSVSLKGTLRPLLELESGSNDPMAVFLTTAFVGLLTSPGASAGALVPAFFWQMALGAAAGYVLGRGAVLLVNRLKLEYEGLYPVLSLAIVLSTYALTSLMRGNGFLAVYVAGIVLGNSHFLHRRSLLHFHDGIAWLMQIAMFITLGLLVFPSRLPPVASEGLLSALFLMLVARPLSVFVCLLPFRMEWREKALVSWVGLRGAVPIVLATFPLLAGAPRAAEIFNIVFFIVIGSVLVQGVSIPFMARLLKVDAPFESKRPNPIEIAEGVPRHMKLVDFLVPYESPMVGKPIVELNFPDESRIALLCRGDAFVVPGGTTTLEGGDVLWVLGNETSLPEVHRRLAGRQADT